MTKKPIITVLEMLLAAIGIVNGAVLLAHPAESSLVWALMDIICGVLCFGVGAHWLIVKKRGVTASAWKIELGLMIPVFAASIVLLLLPVEGKDYYQQMFWLMMSFALGSDARVLKQQVENNWHESNAGSEKKLFWKIILVADIVLFITLVVLMLIRGQEAVHQSLFWMSIIVIQIQTVLNKKQPNEAEEAEKRAEQEKNQYDPDLMHDRYE